MIATARDSGVLAGELLERVEAMAEGERHWVGLAGPPGSGKSTLACELENRLEGKLLVVPQDGYHFTRKELDGFENPEEAHRRRGAPFTFDGERFVRELVQARWAGSGVFPAFEHGRGDPVEGAIAMSSEHRIVLVEGNYLLLDVDPWVRLKEEVFDESWYLDVALEECARRVEARHIAVGRSPEEAKERVRTNDALNAQLVAEVSPMRADRCLF